jgi:phage shock protein E
MGNSNGIESLEAKKLIGQNYWDIILDVREDNEWDDGHYPNATHIPVDKVEKKFKSKFPDKNLKILIYCRSGMRAGKAEGILRTQGYKNINILNSSYTNLL